MAVLIPFQFETMFTTKRQKIGITLLWILTFAISISTYIYYDVTTRECKIFRTRNDPNSQYNASVSFPPKKNESLCLKRAMKQNFHRDIKLVLSISIVSLDLLMILCYSTIIYQTSHKSRKWKTATSKKVVGLPLLCVFIANAYVTFTLPFAVTNFCFGSVSLWAKFCLILNSGMNSVVYFFRHRLESYQAKDS